MHLKSIQIINFRKFSSENNTIEFVASSADFSREKTHNSVAASTTLIVGRNNAGKTTVANALHKLINEASAISGKDFNFIYLGELLEEHTQGNTDNLPFLEFNIVVGVDKTRNDLLSNLSPFISIADLDPNADEIDVPIKVRYEITEGVEFTNDLKQLIDRYPKDKKLLFRKFLKFIDDDVEFSKNYFGLDGSKIKGSFKLPDLITLKTISAQKPIVHNVLSTTINKIIKYRHDNATGHDFTSVEDSLDGINKEITEKISEDHQQTVNDVLHEIESDKTFSVTLSADLSFEKLLNSLIKYEYSEGEFSIPESQFGLGYSNLMYIIGEIISYVEKFPEEHYQSKINLISIEEPEAHMHPQMQELFIKYIDDAVALLLKSAKKKINSQLIITTHSSHILNSKIHSSNSFDNINYISTVEGRSSVIKLNDSAVAGNEKFDPAKYDTEKEFKQRKIDELKFLKKHIKYKVSELFFADAVIFVEGVTEETILPYYIEQDDELKKFYISIFNINGAHGQVYYPLVKLLKVPTLLVTDIDIKRSDTEKDDFKQVSDLNGRKTTNSTIKLFNKGKDDISQLNSYYEDENLFGVFQLESTESYFATSFEESFILTNYQNVITNEILKDMKPRIYKEISESGANGNYEQIKAHSYKLQKKLSGSKSDFSNELLFKLITEEDTTQCPILPSYIEKGLNWLKPRIPKSVKGRS
jgi:putative ATP-dependent endonuclease of OLD family